MIGLDGKDVRRGRGSRRADPEGRRRRPSSRGSRSAASSSSASTTGTPSARASAATRGSSRSSPKQWWCRMEEAAHPRRSTALQAPATSAITPSPSIGSRSTSLEESPDWCVSRQLWWGHQLPIWYRPGRPGLLRRERGRGPRHARSEGVELTRELRTSSTRGSRRRCGRTRHSGGPTRRPNSTRVLPGERQLDGPGRSSASGENCMIWTGLEAARRGALHRRDHPLDGARRRTAAGCRRASAPASTRSRPLDQHGADATRYGLLKISSTQDVRFSPGAIEEGRKLANKLWNVSRLILSKSELRDPVLAPPRRSRSSGSSRGSTRSRAEVEEAWRRFDFAARRRPRSTT